MVSIKRVLVIASMSFVAVLLYQWGQIDGRAGIVTGVIGVSFAGESSQKLSPV